MRIPCPICGERDRREFICRGHATLMHRPETDDPQAWSDWLHLRDNPAGPTRELWYHEAGCGAWLVVDRNTVTHEVIGAALVGGAHAD